MACLGPWPQRSPAGPQGRVPRCRQHCEPGCSAGCGAVGGRAAALLCGSVSQGWGGGAVVHGPPYRLPLAGCCVTHPCSSLCTPLCTLQTQRPAGHRPRSRHSSRRRPPVVPAAAAAPAASSSSSRRTGRRRRTSLCSARKGRCGSSSALSHAAAQRRCVCAGGEARWNGCKRSMPRRSGGCGACCNSLFPLWLPPRPPLCPAHPLQAQAKRAAIRRTWLQHARDHLPGVTVRFILAQVKKVSRRQAGAAPASYRIIPPPRLVAAQGSAR